MRRFRFRLERVLRHHQYLEEQAYNVLQEAIHRRVQHEQVIARIKSEWQYAAMQVAEPEPIYLRQRERYLAALQEQIEQLQELLPLLQAEEEQAREAYIGARRARKMLERLREQAHEQYQSELDAENQKQLDEWAVGRWVMGNG